MKKHKKLKNSISTLLVTAAIIPCVIFIVASSKNLSNEATARIKAETRQNLNSLGKISSEYDSSVETAFSIVQSNRNLALYLENENEFNNIDFIFDEVRSFMGDDLIDIGIYSTISNKFTHSNKERPISSNVSKELWHEFAIKESGSLIEVSTEKLKDGNINVTYAKTLNKTLPISEGSTTPETVDIGVMYITIDLKEMLESSKNLILTQNSNILIFNKNFEVIFDRDNKLVGSNIDDVDWFTELIRSKDKKFLNINIDGKEYIAYKENNRMSDISIIALIPNADILEGVQESILPMFVLAFFIITTIVVIGYSFSRKITKPFGKIIADLEFFKKGDFSKELQVRTDYTSEMKDIVETLNDTRISLSKLINKVKGASGTLEYNSGNLADISTQSNDIMDTIVRSITSISGETENNVGKVGALTSVTENLSKEISNVKNLTEDILKYSDSISSFSNDGKDVVSNLKLSFNENNKITSDVIKNIKEVSNVSKEINTITDSIKNITKETNLLSINASIEASKSGALGKGFAVVAESIRDLANQSSESTKKIDSYVSTIINTIDSLEAKVSSLTKINNVTSDDVEKTYNHFNRIIELIEELALKISTISNSMAIIDGNKEIVSININDVSESSEGVSSSTEEVMASVEEQSAQLEEITSSTVVLSKLATELQSLLDEFKTTDIE